MELYNLTVRVTIVEKGSPHSVCLQESGKILPGVKVVIANPESKGMLGDSHLGEVSNEFFPFRLCGGVGACRVCIPSPLSLLTYHR
jgi:hypothetical protein